MDSDTVRLIFEGALVLTGGGLAAKGFLNRVLTRAQDQRHELERATVAQQLEAERVKVTSEMEAARSERESQRSLEAAERQRSEMVIQAFIKLAMSQSQAQGELTQQALHTLEVFAANIAQLVASHDLHDAGRMRDAKIMETFMTDLNGAVGQLMASSREVSMKLSSVVSGLINLSEEVNEDNSEG